jgi:hypothetical protein
LSAADLAETVGYRARTPNDRYAMAIGAQALMVRKLFQQGADELRVAYRHVEDRIRITVSVHHPTASPDRMVHEALPDYLVHRPCAVPDELIGTAMVLLGHPHPAPVMLDAGRVHWSPLPELGTRWPALFAALWEAPAGAALLVRMRRITETPVCAHLRLAARGYYALAATNSRTGLTTLGTSPSLAVLAQTCAATADRYAGRCMLRCQVLATSPTPAPALYEALRQLPADTGRRWQVHRVDTSLLPTWAGWNLSEGDLAKAVQAGSRELPWALASLVDDIEVSGMMRLPVTGYDRPSVLPPAHRQDAVSLGARLVSDTQGIWTDAGQVRLDRLADAAGLVIDSTAAARWAAAMAQGDRGVLVIDPGCRTWRWLARRHRHLLVLDASESGAPIRLDAVRSAHRPWLARLAAELGADRGGLARLIVEPGAEPPAESPQGGWLSAALGGPLLGAVESTPLGGGAVVELGAVADRRLRLLMAGLLVRLANDVGVPALLSDADRLDADGILVTELRESSLLVHARSGSPAANAVPERGVRLVPARGPAQPFDTWLRDPGETRWSGLNWADPAPDTRDRMADETIAARYRAMAVHRPKLASAAAPFSDCAGCVHRCSLRGWALDHAPDVPLASMMEGFPVNDPERETAWWRGLETELSKHVPVTADAVERCDRIACLLLHSYRACRGGSAARWVRRWRVWAASSLPS